jgi:ACR3 family arsenite transporter
LNPFERYLSLWVALYVLTGIALGKFAPLSLACSALEFGTGSQINLPIAVFKGVPVTPFMNWMVKPFSMALLSWLFFRHVFSQWIFPVEASQYIAGTIILAAAPGTAMVFVCSHLTDEDPACPLVQVSLNDLIGLFLFAPIVRLLVSGAASLSVPFHVLFFAVVAFMAIPLAAGTTLRALLLRRRGKDWFENVLLIEVPVMLSVCRCAIAPVIG